MYTQYTCSIRVEALAAHAHTLHRGHDGSSNDTLLVSYCSELRSHNNPSLSLRERGVGKSDFKASIAESGARRSSQSHGYCIQSSLKLKHGPASPTADIQRFDVITIMIIDEK